ncbi:MAG TPA: HAD family hydrolase, partial [Actinopolymorphaceae bacterium]|nr:HAD family hydrolase [Actinopolymorphaceae bacterium]
LLDLDNTLVDRDAAFRSAAEAFLCEHGLPASDIDWLLGVDASGYRPRSEVAETLRARYPLIDQDAVWRFLDRGAADRVRLTEPNRAALRMAVAHGWTPVVVTNGSVRQQETKLRVSGLDQEVAGWVISEAVGCRKPDPEIFAAAASIAGADLDDGGWLVGDAPHADIGGAFGVGLCSVWLHLGRTWPAELSYRPTHVADDLAAALACLTGVAQRVRE